MAKAKILLVGNNHHCIIKDFIELMMEKGGRLVEIAKNYKGADLEVDISQFNGTSDMNIEVNRILNSAIVSQKINKKRNKAVKKHLLKQRIIINKINKLHESI